jgi:predicted methyltransferase MtxX (methanogen marker protein 4)
MSDPTKKLQEMKDEFEAVEAKRKEMFQEWLAKMKEHAPAEGSAAASGFTAKLKEINDEREAMDAKGKEMVKGWLAKMQDKEPDKKSE